MRSCSICTHSQLKEINQDLINGVPIRKVAKIFGVSKSSLHRHQLEHIGITGQAEKITGQDLKRDTIKPYRDTNVKDNVTEYQGNHWKVKEEEGKAILYFKDRVVPLIPIGDHYQDPKSKEEFKKEGESWYLKIPYHGWVNLDNVFCFYE